MVQNVHLMYDHIQYHWYKDTVDFNHCTSGQEMNTIKKICAEFDRLFLIFLSYLITFLSDFSGKIQI